MSTATFPGIPTEKVEEFKEIISNAMFARREFMRQIFDPRRDLNSECGYPSNIITADTYQTMYDTEAVARRVVQVMSKECWQVQPLVYEVEDATRATAFEKAWDAIGSDLDEEMSYYQDEAGSLVWEYLKRLDEISGIGQYGVLLLGLNDGRDPSQPVVPSDDMKLVQLRCFPESLAQISTFEQNRNSRRFGRPLTYLITFNDPREGYQAITGLTTATVEVHWSRIIHIADNLLSSEVFGVPRMRPVWHRLLDLRKLYGGSAEMYWRGAFPGISLESHPSLGPDVEIDRDRTRDMMEDYMNGLQRYLSMVGMSAKSLAPQVVDPAKQIAVQIEAICIELGIPKRVFMGSERGELASSQDDAAWNDRLRERQNGYITPRVIVPFVNRLINLGVLPKPDKLKVSWPDVTSQTNQERANAALTITQAMAQYWGNSMMGLIPPLDYLTRIVGMNEDEAVAILENVKSANLAADGAAPNGSNGSANIGPDGTAGNGEDRLNKGFTSAQSPSLIKPSGTGIVRRSGSGLP